MRAPSTRAGRSASPVSPPALRAARPAEVGPKTAPKPLRLRRARHGLPFRDLWPATRLRRARTRRFAPDALAAPEALPSCAAHARSRRRAELSRPAPHLRRKAVARARRRSAPARRAWRRWSARCGCRSRRGSPLLGVPARLAAPGAARRRRTRAAARASRRAASQSSAAPARRSMTTTSSPAASAIAAAVAMLGSSGPAAIATIGPALRARRAGASITAALESNAASSSEAKGSAARSAAAKGAPSATMSPERKVAASASPARAAHDLELSPREAARRLDEAALGARRRRNRVRASRAPARWAASRRRAN